MKKMLLLLIVGFALNPLYGQLTQTIRGTVRDAASESPISYATVMIKGTTIGTTTDEDGNFLLSGVPVGRHDVEVSFMGYQPATFKEVQVVSSKQSILTVMLRENAIALGEVTVKPTINKTETLNPMTTVSGKTITVEESKRFAGAFDDPARLVSSFAGVASDVSNNGIVVRGNAPKFLQWRLEDVEIPNPNHFAEVTGFGGGGLAALSNQVLGNSDFFSGAFPSEYGNALSGIFDMKLRNGNNNKREHTAQVGITGLDFASEGYLKKGGKSSYIFNYRYSTMSLLSSLLPENADALSYQDLSFKFNLPTRSAGTFSVWGTGLIDRSGQKAKTNPEEWEYVKHRNKEEVQQYMFATGVGHKYYFNDNTFLKSTIALTSSQLDYVTDRMDTLQSLHPYQTIKNTLWNAVVSTSLTKKFSRRHTNKTGIQYTAMIYDMLLRNSALLGAPLQTVSNGTGTTGVVMAYTNSTIHPSDRLTLNVGVNMQTFLLNGKTTVEPRVGVKYQLNPRHSIGLAYGMHSRLEQLNYYFTRNEQGQYNNHDLDFTRAHHLVASYNIDLGKNLFLRIEPYVQQQYSVPVIEGTSFSLTNLKSDWFLHDNLVNKGEGVNYGIDVTFERFLSHGYYFLITGSLFNSRYKGGDAVWRDSRFNRSYLFNALAGKEWAVGKSKQNVLSLNLRFSYQGGDRYSPVDMKKTIEKQEVVYDETKAYSLQLSPSFVSHFTISYLVNKKNVSHEFAFKVLNATGYKEFYGHLYNLKTGAVTEDREATVLPNISYKLQF